MHEITPCLWFDTEGEEAARFYTTVRFELDGLLSDPDPQRSQRVMRAMLATRRLEIDALERAAAQAEVAGKNRRWLRC